MKKVTFSILTLALCGAAWGQKLDRSIKPKPASAPEIKLGKTESFTLPNGLKVFVVENHKLPVISASIQLDIRPELEGDMAGYREMMSELLLAGTKTRTKDQLNEEIDRMGANIDANSESISANGLKKYQDKIFELMADVAMNVNIPQSELDAVKKKSLSGLATQKNDANAMVQNVAAKLNYGTNHPYGEVPDESTISKISLERCNRYYQTYFRPNVAYMAIVGDVTMAEIKPIVEKYFGSWTKQDVPVSTYTIPEVATTKLTKVAFAPRVGAVQSMVDVTYPIDLKPGSQDVIKARVANTILGGGSQGRLFLDLRETHGWTYGAYSSLSEDALVGNFSATVPCRNIVSDSSVQAVLDEMNMMHNVRVADTTLQNAITYLSGGFAIGLEDPKRVAQFAINIERYNMPKDYYQNYLKNLAAVTADDVMAISKKYIRTDHANIVVAGSKEEVAEKLARFSADGKVDFYDNFGKPMTVSESKAVPAGVTAGDVYKKYITAIGGEKAINGIKDIKVIMTSEMQGMPLTITEMKKAPNLFKQTVAVSMNGSTMVVQKQVFNGTKAYVEAQGQKKDVTGEELDALKQTADIAHDLHDDKYGIKRSIKGIEKINGADAYVMEVTEKNGDKSTEYYDVTNSLLVKKVAGEGEKLEITEFADYKAVTGANGFKVPYKITQNAGGMNFVATVTTVEVNKNIAATEFN